MIVPVEADCICMKIDIADQQRLEEMMLRYGMTYTYSKFPSLSSRHSYDGAAYYYAVHQENEDRGQELKFYKELGKAPLVTKVWTISSEGLGRIMNAA